MSYIFVFLLSFSQLFAGPYFTNLRDDQSVPESCRELKFKYFQMPAERFFVGRDGAVSMGFTFEYPLKRKNATVLWRYFKSLTHGKENEGLRRKILANSELKRDYDVIVANYQEQGFDFGNEGEILEILAIHNLYQEFPENMYFITGGIEYHEEYSPKTIGELDLFVGRRDTCETIAVGEAKLGSGKTLSKARKQLRRLENFLMDHSCAGFSGEYEPREKSIKSLLKAG